MNKLWIAVVILFIFIACSTSKDVVLSMTNPQDLSVSFSGYYYFDSLPEDTITLNGVTPREYEIVLEKGEVISGIVHKDGSDMTDTLHFRILVNDDEKLTQKTTAPSQVIQFDVSAE